MPQAEELREIETGPPQLPVLLRPTEAMAALRISYATLRRMIDRGDLRVVRLGEGRCAPIRVPVSELERLTGCPR
jgi:excisionase family DNA binding protein